MRNGLSHFFEPGRGRLVGFATASRSGFALPLYGNDSRGNSLFTAHGEISGDPASPIVAFEGYWQTDPPVQLLDAPGPDVEIGSLPLHVFLWDGVAHSGSLAEIRDKLQDRIGEIRSRSPIACLGLMGDEADPDFSRSLYLSTAVLAQRLGVTIMREWAFGTYFASLAKVVLRREAKNSAWNDETYAAIGKVHISWDGESVRLHSPSPLHDRLNSSESRASELVRSLFAPFNSLDPDSSLFFVKDQKSGSVVERKPVSERVVEQGVAICSVGAKADGVVRSLRRVGWPVTSVKKVPPKSASSDRANYVLSTNQMMSDLQPLVLVVIVGEDVLEDPWLEEEFSRLCEAVSDLPERCIAFLAPALPAKRPSDFLIDSAVYQKASKAFEAVVDTSLARSPFWWGAEYHSLDRRVADIINGVVNATFSLRDTNIMHMLGAARGAKPELLGLLSYPDGATTAETVSEAGALFKGSLAVPVDPRVYSTRFGGRQKGDPTVALTSLSLGTDFASLAAAAIMRSEAVAHDPDRYALKRFPNDPSVLRTLRYPDLASSFELTSRGAPTGLPIMLCAESPTLEALKAAKEELILLARYTDSSAVSLFLADNTRRIRGILPFDMDILLPPRRIAARALVQRGQILGDAVRFGGAELEEALTYLSKDDIAMFSRRRLAPRRTGKPAWINEWVLPRRFAGITASRTPEDARLPDRRKVLKPGGLAAGEGYFGPWDILPNGLERIAIEDGVWPIAPKVISETAFVDSRFVVLISDPAVAGLLVSKPFHVWTKAMSKPRSSWPDRFPLDAIFSRFPYEAFHGFTVDQTSVAGRFAVRFDGSSRLRQLFESVVKADLLEQYDSPDVSGGWGTVQTQLIDDIDAELLAHIGLRGGATEFDILVRLLEFNRNLRFVDREH